MPTAADRLRQIKGGQPQQAQTGITAADRLRQIKSTGPITGQSKIQLPEMRTPQQMEEQMTTKKELPFGAIGWKPDGTADYGPGIEGWWKGITSRVYAPVVENGTERPATQFESVMRAEGEGFNQLISALQQPQQWFYSYLADRRTYEMYADMVNTKTPDIYMDNELGNFLRITNAIIPGISNLTTMYEKERIKNGNRILPSGTFEKIQEANRIWNKENVGTAIFNPQIQSEYIRQVLAGENPYDLVKQMAKPVENFIADFALDPLNATMFADVAIKLFGKSLGIATKIVETGKVLPQFEEAAKLFWKADKAADVTDDIARVAQKIVETTVEHVDDAHVIKGTAFELTQNSKMSTVLDRMKLTLIPIANFVRGDAAKGEAVKVAIAQLGSSDVEVVKKGLQFLVDNHLGSIYLNENGLTTARVLNKILVEGEGFAGKALMEAVALGDGALASQELMKITVKVVDDLFPDVNKIVDAVDEIGKIRAADPLAELPSNLKRFENVKISKTTRTIARFHKTMQENWFGTKFGNKNINEMFALIYLSSPGFTVRNYYNAVATAFVDLGFGSMRELLDFSGGSAKYLEDMFGTSVDVIAKSFSAATKTAETSKLTGILKPLEIIRSWASKGEEFESVAIAVHAGKNYSHEMLQVGRYVESMEALKTAGFSEQSLNMLEKLVRKHNGKTAEAVAEFSKMFDNGTIEHFREPEAIFSKALIDNIHAENPQLMDSIRAALKEGTFDDVMKKVDDILTEHRAKMYSEVDDIVADFADDEVKSLMRLSEEVGANVPDENLSIFAKKANVRRDVMAKMELAANKVLSGLGNKEEQFIRNKNTLRDAVTNVTNNLGDAVKKYSKMLNEGMSPKELIKLIEKDPLFAKMAEYKNIPSLRTFHSKESVKTILWEYYRNYTEELWFNTIKQNYDFYKSLIKTEGFGAIKSSDKLRAIEAFDLEYTRAQRYLSALLKDGKAYSNDSYFWYKLGDRITSVYYRAKELGLATGAHPHKMSMFDLINSFREAGLGKIGNLNNEENYLDAMKILDVYADRKAKVAGARKAFKAIEDSYVNTGKTMSPRLSVLRDELKTVLKSADRGELDKLIERIVKAASEDLPSGVVDVRAIIDESVSAVKKFDPTGFTTVIDDLPIIDDGNIPSIAKVYKAGYTGYQQMMGAVKKSIEVGWNKRELVNSMTAKQASELANWAARNEARMLDFRSGMLRYMKGVRDFALLDYAGNKRNIDLALGYLFPYQFWYSRSYLNWAKRLVANPNIMNNYAKFRNFLEEENKNLPEYMRNNVVIGPKNNPIILNLEASFNPLNGLTGVDFTDKNKIVGTPGTLEYAWTSTLDAIGKYGPSVWSPINMATAFALSQKGEKEAAARWAGRFFPQTPLIKAVGSLAGQNWELDPFVALFGEGSSTDPYESRRVGRALVGMTEAGKITKEQAVEAARLRSGDVWNQAVIESTRNRAWGTISAWTLGQGFKIRTGSDAEIDKFYEDYFKMWENASKFTPDEMSNYQKYIREKYPFADLVILSGKGSSERDRAYTYSVLSRVAPGQTGDIMKALGVNPALTDLFYQSKGDMSAWNPLDKEAFMNAMVQIGTLVAIPSDTTSQQWQKVKLLYKQVDREISSKFGEDILSKIEMFYELPYGSPEQKNFMEANPKVQEAMDYKDFLIGSNKDMAPYYDGFTRMQRYYDGEFRRQVTEQIDPNYYEYYQMRSLIIDPAELKQFDRQVGWTDISKRYTAFKKQWDMNVWKQLDQYDKFFMTEAVPTGMQAGVDMSIGQQAIQGILAPAQAEQRKVTWQQITSAIPMPITLEKAIQQYITSDRVFSSSENTMVGKLLNNVNYMYGLNLSKEDLLSLAMDYYQ